MKILQHGRYVDNPETQRVCDITCACGCRFLFTNRDPAIERDNYCEKIPAYIKCPECNTPFRLSALFFLP